MTILVTGGAGFIGSNFVLHWLTGTNEQVINVDCLTYAANLANLQSIMSDPRHVFVRANITDRATLSALLDEYQPRAVLNFAAETHVDRSIAGADSFITSNVNGVFELLEASREYWSGLADARASFRFLHISTDEVFGSLAPDAASFTENHRFEPNSPYAASKAASDHLVRAWSHTYGLPVVTSNCSNNYGPYQFPEKLIPLMIVNALSGRQLPIYGDGAQVRDWLFVQDHCHAIERVLESGRPGETYNVGGCNERTNIQVVTQICDLLDELRPRTSGGSYRTQMAFVPDRPGHDRRYAIDATKIQTELGWKPIFGFDAGLRATVRWYLDNPDWIESVSSGAYRQWVSSHYGASDV